jgi:hypothetical protein
MVEAFLHQRGNHPGHIGGVHTDSVRTAARTQFPVRCPATRDVLADCSIDTGTTRVVLALQDLQKTRFEQTKPYAGPWPSGTGMGRTKKIDDLVNADLGHASVLSPK